jgi:hypothetical protein
MPVVVGMAGTSPAMTGEGGGVGGPEGRGVPGGPWRGVGRDRGSPGPGGGVGVTWGPRGPEGRDRGRGRGGRRCTSAEDLA